MRSVIESGTRSPIAAIATIALLEAFPGPASLHSVELVLTMAEKANDRLNGWYDDLVMAAAAHALDGSSYGVDRAADNRLIEAAILLMDWGVTDDGELVIAALLSDSLHDPRSPKTLSPRIYAARLAWLEAAYDSDIASIVDEISPSPEEPRQKAVDEFDEETSQEALLVTAALLVVSVPADIALGLRLDRDVETTPILAHTEQLITQMRRTRQLIVKKQDAEDEASGALQNAAAALNQHITEMSAAIVDENNTTNR